MNENHAQLNSPGDIHQTAKQEAPILPGWENLNDSSIVPILGSTLRPLAVLGIRGILGVVECTQSSIAHVREEIEDIVAEAQFERYKQQMDKDIDTSSTGLERESD